MIPSRFVTEYPERCLDLMLLMEPVARKRDLIGSFSLLVAAAAFTIPYERAKARHVLAQPFNEADLYSSLEDLEQTPLLKAPLWDGHSPGQWTYGRVKDVGKGDWINVPQGTPLHEMVHDTMSKRKSRDVFRVIRNALAHGNIVYLDESRRERAGRKVFYLAFLSHYHETKAEQEADGTLRMVMVPEADFLNFVKCWVKWLQRFPAEDNHIEGAAA